LIALREKTKSTRIFFASTEVLFKHRGFPRR